MIRTDILVIGGGLAGLALADRLESAGADYRLVEARERLGGRILTQTVKGAEFDIGPAWFWPGQPRMAALVERLGLKVFQQYARGDLVVEDENGRVQRGRGFASMEGSYRIGGGLGRIISGLASSIQDDRILTGAMVHSICHDALSVSASLTTGEKEETIQAERAVLALPPRVASSRIAFLPDLTPAVRRTMSEIPTWMAGQAKILAVFDRPYWREHGFSGDAMSRHGPMVEVHDASPEEGGPYALFGFVGVPAAKRKDHEETVLALARQQLIRLFGDGLSEPLSLTMKDWADDPLTATPSDQIPSSHHPTYGLPASFEKLWGGRLIFGSTEVGSEYGGYLEGALEAAEHAFEALVRLPVRAITAVP